MVSQRIDGSLTAEQLRTILNYDPETGLFTWRHRADRARNWNSRRANKPAGGFDGQYGYLSIRINYQLYQAHRLAWLYMAGEWPEHILDHIDGNPANNAWSNLRPATREENNRNKKLPPNEGGYRGIYRSGNKWSAAVMVRRKAQYLGLFATREEAHAAYVEAAQRLHGAFARLK